MSRTENRISPREIYQIFSANLRELVDRTPVSVTQICQDIGVNRTQFNRYLAGQASPRPDILHRICTYFQLDARVLLEPLSHIESQEPLRPRGRAEHEPQHSPSRASESLRNFIRFSNDRLMLSPAVPLGVHRFWQRSSVHENWVNSFTIRIFKMDGATVFRAKSDPQNDKILKPYATQGVNEFFGVLLSQVDGVALLTFKNDSLRIGMSYLTRLTTESPILSGITMISRPELTQATRLERCVLEFLPQGSGLRPALRNRGGKEIGELPDFIAYGLRGGVH